MPQVLLPAAVKQTARHLLCCCALWPCFAVVHQLWRLADVLPDLVNVALLKLAPQQLLVPLACVAVTPDLALARSTHCSLMG